MDNLQKSFGFTDEDLAANRQGRIGQNQMSNVRDRRWLGLTLFVAAFALVGLTVYFNVTSSWFAVLLLFIGLLAKAGVSWLQYQQWSDAPPKVMCVSGLIILHRWHGGGDDCDSFSVTIGNQVFDLQPKQYKLLRNGHDYRFYFTEWPHNILSVEELGGSSPFPDSSSK